MARQPQDVMVIQPELADDDEADQPAQELRRQLDELTAQLAHAAMITQLGELELQHQQR
jgi:hypothetical protein